jgi:peptidylprolyl isomerase
MTRSNRVACAAAVLAVVALAGCSGGSGTDPADGPDSSAAAAAPSDAFPAIVFTDGVPAMTPLDEAPPAELQVKVLTEGSGATVTADQTVTVDYAGWLWSDGTRFDSSYGVNPITFPLSSLIRGWQEGLAGQKVGSTVELVIPPNLGYGSTAVGSIPADSTLVFVVDLIAADA